MWTFECSEVSAASPADVWALWSDPARWPEFDRGVVWARLDEPFAAGSTVVLKPRGGPKARVAIESADPARGFSTHAKLPLTHLRFEHSLAPAADGGTRLASQIRVNGLLAPIVPRVFKL